jgi:hypothetical protein
MPEAPAHIGRRRTGEPLCVVPVSAAALVALVLMNWTVLRPRVAVPGADRA